MTMNTVTKTDEGDAPRKLETKTCSRCGGSGRMPFAVYGGVCFKCHGPGQIYTKRGRAAHAYLARLRERTLAEIKPGMLVLSQGFSCGSINVPSKFHTVESVGELKPTGQSKIGDGPWIQNYGHDLVCSGKDGKHVHSGLKMDSLLRVGHTGLGKRETFRAALDYQDALTKSGTVRKGATVRTAEEFLATTETYAWLVREPVTLEPETTRELDEANRHAV